MNVLKNRKVINFFLVLSGYLVLVTGLCLFFDFNYVGIDDIHEISGLALGGAAILHILLNWKPLLHSLGAILNGKVALAVAAITIVGLVCFWRFGIYQPDPNDMVQVSEPLPQ